MDFVDVQRCMNISDDGKIILNAGRFGKPRSYDGSYDIVKLEKIYMKEPQTSEISHVDTLILQRTEWESIGRFMGWLK